MRKMPQLPVSQKSTILTTSFRGYNHQEVIEDGEMYDMLNMSADMYPLLTPRKRRGITSLDEEGSEPVPLTGIHGRDQLVFIRGTDVYYNLEKITGISVSTDSAMMPKKIVSFGAYVCIFPDKVYFNTADSTDKGSMDRTFSVNGQNVQISMCRGDGTDYDRTTITVSINPPENPANGALWLDQSGSTDVLKQWMSVTEEWMEVGTTYVKIQATGIGSGLKMYDVISLTGLAAATGTDEHVAEQVDALNGSVIVYFAGENYIVIAGVLSNGQNALADQSVRADRTVPEMDYICESNNRLWGCHYGLRDGVTVNEIYASALGDFRNWNRFMGNSQDSYTASVGTDGAFTGAITQRGYPVFFKENFIHRVSGQTPSSFTINTTVCRGVQRGSWRSVAVVNEAIYYKSRKDVMVYDGSMPEPISEQLGDVLYSDARAGVLGSKYYISMKDAQNSWTQFVYDTKQGTWYKEDGFHALGYGSVEDELYAIDEDHNTLVTITGSMGTVEEYPNWSATFQLHGAEYGRGGYGSRIRNDITNRRYMSRFVLRIYIEPGSHLYLDIKYDDGDWMRKGEITGDRLDSYLIPVIPRRCDHLRFRLSGDGYVRIYSISRKMEAGGEG